MHLSTHYTQLRFMYACMHIQSKCPVNLTKIRDNLKNNTCRQELLSKVYECKIRVAKPGRQYIYKNKSAGFTRDPKPLVETAP